MGSISGQKKVGRERAHLMQKKTGGWVSRVYPLQKKIAVQSDCSIQVVVILDTRANSSSNAQRRASVHNV